MARPRLLPLCCLAGLASGVAGCEALTRTSPPAAEEALEEWTLEPDLRIGSLDDPHYAFTEVTSLAVDTAGSMYVLDWREQSVRVFDGAGRYRRSIGRRGAGPGEFAGAGRLGWKGDSLWVLDGLNQRLSFFAPGGEFLTSVGFSRSLGDLSGRLLPGVPLADGSLLLTPSVGIRLLVDGVVDSLPVYRLSREGEVLDTLARVSMRHSHAAIRDPSGANPGGVYTRQPLADRPLQTVTADGTALVIVTRRAAAQGDSAHFDLLKVGLSGDTVLHREIRYRPEPLHASLRDSLIASLTDRETVQRALGRPPRATVEQWVRQALYLPPYLPPVSDLLAGRDGTIWLRRENLPAERMRWEVFDAEGTAIAVVWVPAATRLLAADRSFAWGIEKDELDVPYVVRYRLEPARGER